MMSRQTTGTRSKDTPLFDIVFQRIEKNESKSVPFSVYVELLLYHPEFGYYARPADRKVGRRGDFFTSVSVGETFGMLLARRIEAAMENFPPEEQGFHIVEQGAHDGRLARDICAALAERVDREIRPWRYFIVEPRETVRESLASGLRDTPEGESIGLASSFDAASAEQGIFLCNELLDAFPFDRVIREGGQWKELHVVVDRGELAWGVRPLGDRVAAVAEDLPGDLPDGYVTEVRPGLSAWMDEAAGLFRRGEWWIIDYGFESADYFASHRSEGTWRCYRRHRATEDPFLHPGETDITAHVNFSQLRCEAESAGLEWVEYSDQHHFLTEAARPWLLEQEGCPPDASMAARLRQFQTLTHPGMMGKQFKIARLARR